jgi:natural product precursor
MKKTTKPSQDAVSSAKGKPKIKSLKLRKETVQDLSDRDAAAVKGGRSSSGGSYNGSIASSNAT